MPASEGRERILGRIRAALREPAHRPAAATDSYGSVYDTAGAPLIRFTSECKLN